MCVCVGVRVQNTEASGFEGSGSYGFSCVCVSGVYCLRVVAGPELLRGFEGF